MYMKQRIVYFLLGWVVALSGQAQVRFDGMGLASAQIQARHEKKIVFLDLYTTWCAPCKWMDAHVFADSALGQLLNDQAINIRLDAEAGDGPRLVQQFSVGSYPTYLFMKADGTILSRIEGAMNVARFTQKVNFVLSLMNDQPLDVYQQNFEKGQRDEPFLTAFFYRQFAENDRSTQLGAIVEALMTTLPDSLRSTENTLDKVRLARNVLGIHSKGYQALSESYADDDLAKYKMFIPFSRNSLRWAVEQQNDTLRQRVIERYQDFWQKHQHKEPLLKLTDLGVLISTTMRQYRTQPNQMAAALDTIVTEQLLTVSDSQRQVYDVEALNRALAPYRLGMLDSLDGDFQKIKRYERRNYSLVYAGTLHAAAKAMNSGLSGGEILSKAIAWMQRAIEIDWDSESYRTLAHLQYKIQRWDEALTNQQRAVEIARQVDTDAARLLENELRAMQEKKPLPE
jgi:thiol-disulfide isomerase/thioredoxin